MLGWNEFFRMGRRSSVNDTSSSIQRLIVEQLEERCLLTYTLIDLGTLGGSYISSDANGINAEGEIVGESLTSSGIDQAFLWKDGVMTGLGTLGGTSSYAEGINDAGVVVGSSGTTAGRGHAFYYDSFGMHDLGTLGDGTDHTLNSWAFGINDSGQVVGASGVSYEVTHAFSWQPPDITARPRLRDLGALSGYPHSEALGVNASGEIFGQASSDWPNYFLHAFFIRDGVMQDIGTLGGAENRPQGMNDAGEIVGTSLVNGGGFHAYVWRDGVMDDLGIYGYFASVARGINNLDQVVGTGGPNDKPFIWQNGVMTDLTTLIDYQTDLDDLIPQVINDAGLIAGTGFNRQGQSRAFLLMPDDSMPDRPQSDVVSRQIAVAGPQLSSQLSPTLTELEFAPVQQLAPVIEGSQPTHSDADADAWPVSTGRLAQNTAFLTLVDPLVILTSEPLTQQSL
jgi:probable HAF family extracellular repeat protein